MDNFSHVLQIFHSNCLFMADSIFAFMLFARMDFVYLNSIMSFLYGVVGEFANFAKPLFVRLPVTILIL